MRTQFSKITLAAVAAAVVAVSVAGKATGA